MACLVRSWRFQHFLAFNKICKMEFFKRAFLFWERGCSSRLGFYEQVLWIVSHAEHSSFAKTLVCTRVCSSWKQGVFSNRWITLWKRLISALIKQITFCIVPLYPDSPPIYWLGFKGSEIFIPILSDEVSLDSLRHTPWKSCWSFRS